jgi:hypothetical protein
MFKSGRRRGAVLVGGKPFAYARHPGTAARPFWDEAKNATAEQAPRVMRAETQRKLGNAFR